MKKDDELSIDEWTSIFGIIGNKDYFCQRNTSTTIVVWSTGHTKYFQVGYDFKEHDFFGGGNWIPSRQQLRDNLRSFID